MRNSHVDPAEVSSVHNLLMYLLWRNHFSLVIFLPVKKDEYQAKMTSPYMDPICVCIRPWPSTATSGPGAPSACIGELSSSGIHSDMLTCCLSCYGRRANEIIFYFTASSISLSPGRPSRRHSTSPGWITARTSLPSISGRRWLRRRTVY